MLDVVQGWQESITCIPIEPLSLKVDKCFPVFNLPIARSNFTFQVSAVRKIQLSPGMRIQPSLPQCLFDFPLIQIFRAIFFSQAPSFSIFFHYPIKRTLFSVVFCSLVVPFSACSRMSIFLLSSFPSL